MIDSLKGQLTLLKGSEKTLFIIWMKPKERLICSALRFEGCSTITSLLARSLALSSKESVLIVDANMRFPSIHKYFNLPIEDGLLDVVSGELEPEASISGNLVLMNEHIQSYTPSENSFGILRTVPGYSFFTHKLMSKTFPEYWLQGTWKSVRAHSKGSDIACRIFERLKHYAQEEKVELYVLVQYEKDEFEKNSGVVDEMITCIDQDVLTLIDLSTSLAELKEHDINKYDDLFQGHMTGEGNYFIATTLWEAITKRNGMSNNNAITSHFSAMLQSGW